jgi:hypothetical protein
VYGVSRTAEHLQSLKVDYRRWIILQEASPVSGVFRNIDPPPPSPPGECVTPPPPAFGEREDTPAGWRRGGGSIVRKTPDTALYSKYFVLINNKRCD